MLTNGIIERANSQYINPLVVVTKPSGAIRLCLDASKLNSLLVPDYECARSVDELFQKGHGVLSWISRKGSGKFQSDLAIENTQRSFIRIDVSNSESFRLG